MAIITPPSLRTPAPLSLLSVLFLMLALSACTNPVEITPDDPTGEEPAPAVSPAEKQYRVDIDFKRIRVVGDCEADPIVTVKGRFAYRLSVSSQRSDGSWTSPEVIKQTRRYGSKDGDVVKRASGTDINVNRRHTLVLPTGANYKMHFSAIEWDGSKRDHRMDGASVVEENNAGGSKLKYEHGLDLGQYTSCRLKLYVDAREAAL